MTETLPRDVATLLRADRPRGVSRRWQFVTALAPLTLVIALTLAGALKFLDYKVHDLAFKLFVRAPDPGLVLVEIDATSLLALERWPWPRHYHAGVIDNLRRAGASRIAIDIDFSSSSSPSEDQALADALERADGSVILPAFVQYARGTMSSGTILSEPLPLFRDHVSLASVNVRPARDGLIRHTTIAEQWHSGSMASMAALLAGGRAVPHPYNTYAIDYGISIESIPSLSFVDVLTGNFDPEQIRGQNILIGATAIELKDVLPVPVYQAMSGVHLHAVAYQSIIQQRMLQSPSPVTTVLILILVNFLLARLFERLSWQRGLVVVCASATAFVAIHLTLYALLPVLFDVAALLSLISLLYVSTILSKIDRQSFLLLLQDFRLRRVDAMMRTTVECSFDSILTIDADHRVVTANAAARRSFAADEHGLAGLEVVRLMPEFASFIGDEPENPRGHVFGEARRLDGSTFPAEIALSKSDDRSYEFHIAVIRNVARRQEQERLLRHQARHDALTELPNRTALSEALEDALAAADAASFALLLIDLDRFKEVNDTLGHQSGDRLLVAVAQRLSQVIDETAVFARLGGDEFAVLLPPPATLLQAESLAHRLSDALEASFNFGGISLAQNASIGIAMYPEHAGDVQQLLQCADVAMYLSKAGNDRFAVYDADRDRNSVRHLALTGQLSQAIKDKQIRFYFQPKFDLSTGRLCGAEALARWEHPELGTVAPNEFIRVAETTGLIKPLTDLALKTGIEKIAEWQNHGLAISVAVNLPAPSVHDPNLPNLIEACLACHAIDPSALALEITEGTLMEDPAGAARNLGAVSDLGVQVSIDDFGTGYSSLSYLSQMPVSELKIDRSFVAAMMESETDEAIVRSTIDLAHNLGLRVVAEGIETAEQLRRLVNLGCDVGQGFWFSKPLEENAFLTQMTERFLEASNPRNASRATPSPAQELDHLSET